MTDTYFPTGRVRRSACTDWPIYLHVAEVRPGVFGIFETCNGASEADGPPTLFDSRAAAEEWIAGYCAECRTLDS